MDFLANGMGLVDLPFKGWMFCLIVASLTLWVSEIYKWVSRLVKGKR
jgi:hypothetical protein